MTHTPRILALPLDTLDRHQARYRRQDDDYRVATELTLSRSDYEGLGRPTTLYATLSGEVPQLPVSEVKWYADPEDPENGAQITADEWARLPKAEQDNWVEVAP